MVTSQLENDGTLIIRIRPGDFGTATSGRTERLTDQSWQRLADGSVFKIVWVVPKEVAGAYRRAHGVEQRSTRILATREGAAASEKPQNVVSGQSLFSESGLSLALKNESCGLCGQDRDAKRVACESLEVALFGAAKYAWCLFCFRQVPKPWKANYRIRWDEEFLNRVAVTERCQDRFGSQIGQTLRNRQGTRCHFRVCQDADRYQLTLHISDARSHEAMRLSSGR
jgi:hypothetical protein